MAANMQPEHTVLDPRIVEVYSYRRTLFILLYVS